MQANKNWYRRGMLWCVLMLSACTFFFSSCSSDDEETIDSSLARTIIVYAVAENSLSNAVPSDIYEMIQGAKQLTDNDCIVLYVDDINAPRIYCITNQTQATDYNSLVAEKVYGEEFNSADPAILSQILQYAKTRHPADSYGIVFWSHASGWETIEETASAANGRQTHSQDLPALKFSFGIDNGKNQTTNVTDPSTGEMGIMDLAKVCESFGKVDFMLFDCCFMQTIEVAYQLRNATKYIMGSPAEIPNLGAPYDKIIPLMASDNIDCQKIVGTYYDHYAQTSYGSILSVISTDGLPVLADATRQVYDKYKNSLEDIDFTQANNYFNYDVCRHNRDNRYPDFYDMNSVMKLWLSNEDYTQWKQAFDKAVVCSLATNRYYSGFRGNTTTVDPATAGCVSMFFPLQKYRDDLFINSYFRLDWSKALGIYK